MRRLLGMLLPWSPAAWAADLSRLGLGELRAQAERGTLPYVAPASGGVAVFDGPSHQAVGGPPVAFGAEWRL